LGKTETNFSKLRKEAMVFTIPTFIQYSTGIPSQKNMTEGRNKRNSNKEGRNQIVLTLKTLKAQLKSSFVFYLYFLFV
jgi:hypothetical protein